MKWTKAVGKYLEVHSPDPLPKLNGRNIVVNVTRSAKKNTYEVFVKLSDDVPKKKKVDRLLYHGERKGLKVSKEYAENIVKLIQEVMQ